VAMKENKNNQDRATKVVHPFFPPPPLCGSTLDGSHFVRSTVVGRTELGDLYDSMNQDSVPHSSSSFSGLFIATRSILLLCGGGDCVVMQAVLTVDVCETDECECGYIIGYTSQLQVDCVEKPLTN
jgi:hypothetical protein